jgi:hypothetical protein
MGRWLSEHAVAVVYGTSWASRNGWRSCERLSLQQRMMESTRVIGGLLSMCGTAQSRLLLWAPGISCGL